MALRTLPLPPVGSLECPSTQRRRTLLNPPGPDTRVVELRVHGVMGTPPEALVSAAAAVDVAGDGVGRIVQPADRLLRPAPGPMLRAEGQSIPRTVEGYSWGGMTSGGAAK